MNENDETSEQTNPDTLAGRIAMADAAVETINANLLPKQPRSWELEEERRLELEQQIWEMQNELEQRDMQLLELEQVTADAMARWRTVQQSGAVWFAALMKIANQDTYGNPRACYLKSLAQDAIDETRGAMANEVDNG